MKKIRSILLTLGLVIYNLINSSAFAQDDPGFPGDDDPGLPVAPIDDWVIPMLVIGIGLTFMVYRRKLKLECK